MTRRTRPAGPTLSLRALNRAMLARQMLLARQRLEPVAAIERLAALQAQWAPSPYVALWSRLASFDRERLWKAIEDARVIRARLMRGTLHLVAARDFYAFAVATQDLQRGAWNRLQIGKGVDPKVVARVAMSYARTPRAKRDVLAHLGDRVGKLGEDFNWLIWRFVSAHADLVTAPPGGRWDYGGTDAPYVAARHWIKGNGSRPGEDAAIEHLVRKALAAFGPMSLADLCQFAGQVPPRIRPALERLGPTLATFADPQGRTLYDLPRAPRPDEDAPAPVRFLPRWDEVLIAYAQRARILAAPHRAAIYSKNAMVEAVVLVDGFVAGTWALERTKTDAVVRVRPFGKLAPSDRAEAVGEGERLARFMAPEAKAHGARVGTGRG